MKKNNSTKRVSAPARPVPAADFVPRGPQPRRGRGRLGWGPGTPRASPLLPARGPVAGPLSLGLGALGPTTRHRRGLLFVYLGWGLTWLSFCPTPGLPFLGRRAAAGIALCSGEKTMRNKIKCR